MWLWVSGLGLFHLGLKLIDSYDTLWIPEEHFIALSHFASMMTLVGTTSFKNKTSVSNSDSSIIKSPHGSGTSSLHATIWQCGFIVGHGLVGFGHFDFGTSTRSNRLLVHFGARFFMPGHG